MPVMFSARDARLSLPTPALMTIGRLLELTTRHSFLGMVSAVDVFELLVAAVVLGPVLDPVSVDVIVWAPVVLARRVTAFVLL